MFGTGVYSGFINLGKYPPADPLPPKFVQNHAVFRQFSGKTPILITLNWAQGPPWGQNSDAHQNRGSGPEYC